MRKFFYFLLAFVSFNLNAAPQSTDWGKVTFYGTGWSQDTIRIITDAAFLNTGCGATDGYVTDPSDPGNHAHQSALLAAFMSGKDVQLVLDGCFLTRPKIIGAYVR